MANSFAQPVFSIPERNGSGYGATPTAPVQNDDAYIQVLGFSQHPFPVSPDEEHFYISGHIERIVAEIVHAIVARKGFMALSGDVGLGKTTISRRIMRILAEKGIHTSLVFHTSLKDVDLLHEINRDFGACSDANGGLQSGLGDALRQLYDFLLARYRQGGNCAILIDDAQNLDRDSLELVRMISNLEADGRKLVQVLLVGQPELMEKLNSPALRQLRSRIFIDKAVRPLTREEMRNYIVFKLSLAANPGRISVAPEACRLLYSYSRGNFRRINMLMDRCLYAICRSASPVIDAHTVRLARDDMRPAKRSPIKRLPAMVAAVLLAIFVGAGAWMLHLYTSRDAMAKQSQAVQAQRAQQPGIAAMSEPFANSSPAAETKRSTHADDRAVDLAFRRFLAAYGLSSRFGDFKQAYNGGTLPLWAESIVQETGQQLVCLPVMSSAIQHRYGVLQMMSHKEERPVWYLFWKPDFAIERFYYGYASDQVLHLQRLLAGVRAYTGRLDGVVGPRLMKALVEFQTRKGLSVTGLPDAETVFMLSHQSEGLS